MSCAEVGDSSINLNSREDTFEIKKDNAVQLTTLSMDFGDIYIIEYYEMVMFVLGYMFIVAFLLCILLLCRYIATLKY